MSEELTIETPENISFGYEVAGVGSRFVAAFIDALIQGAIFAFLAFVFILLSIPGTLFGLPRIVSDWLSVAFVVALFLIYFGYFILFEIFMGGQSPGKRLTGLRVVKENGYPLSPLDSIIRNMIRLVDALPVAYGVGVVTMLLNDRAKRLGDFAAGTLVVKLREQVKVGELQLPAPTNVNVPELPGLRQLTEADIETVESFLRRRRELKNAEALAATLAERLRARMDEREVDRYAASLAPEVFLQQVVAAYRRTR